MPTKGLLVASAVPTHWNLECPTETVTFTIRSGSCGENCANQTDGCVIFLLTSLGLIIRWAMTACCKTTVRDARESFADWHMRICLTCAKRYLLDRESTICKASD